MHCDLTSEEIARSIDPKQFPAILTPDQASSLLQIAKTTLYRKTSEGSFRSAVRRGKPLRFWRDRLLMLFFAGVSKGRPVRSRVTKNNPGEQPA